MSTRRSFFFINLGLIFLLCLCLAIAHQSIIYKLSLNWSSADNNYCYFIIPLFAFLCWDRRTSFRFDLFSWSPWGLAALPAAIGILLIGELASTITLLHIGAWGCIVSLLTTLYGRRIRQLTFPIVILFFITPLPDLTSQMLIFRFKAVAGSLAAMMLRLSGVDVYLEGNVIDLGITNLMVNEACSGLRYLIPLFILALLIGYFFTQGLWRRGALVLTVIPIAVVLNAFRIWFTAILCLNNHSELAENFFHDFSGIFVFMVAAGTVLEITILLNRIR